MQSKCVTKSSLYLLHKQVLSVKNVLSPYLKASRQSAGRNIILGWELKRKCLFEPQPEPWWKTQLWKSFSLTQQIFSELYWDCNRLDKIIQSCSHSYLLCSSETSNLNMFFCYKISVLQQSKARKSLNWDWLRHIDGF